MMKTTTLCIIFTVTLLLINGAPLITLSESNELDESHDIFQSSSTLPLSAEAIFQQTMSENIQIKTVDDGLNLAVTIENSGSITYRNIRLNIKVTGGLLLSPRSKDYTIPELTSTGENKEYTLQNQLFGISLNTFNPLHISILLNNSDQKVIGQVYGFLIGPYLKITDLVLNEQNSYEGYNLYTPEYGKNVYLIDNNGEIVHQINTNNIQGMATYLLENGNIIRSDIETFNAHFPHGGITGHVGIYEPTGRRIWDFTYSNSQHCLHHDIEPLPNGNILMLVWNDMSSEEAIEAGRNPDTASKGLIVDSIIEVKPNGSNGGEIVWEWNVWDHLIQDFDETKENYGIVRNHPELIDLNYGTKQDFTHINSIDYNEELNQILVSVREYGEIWVIDHSTTTEEAANHSGGKYGKGGDLLYRWGNPAAYNAGDEEDQRLFSQHDANWIPSGYPGEGNILIFNNKIPMTDNNNPNIRYYSQVEEISPPVDADGDYYKIGLRYGPQQPTWRYDTEEPFDFYSSYLSSAQRLPNGNTLICLGEKGRFIEVTAEKDLVWQYTNQYGAINHVFKVQRYDPDHPGIQALLD